MLLLLYLHDYVCFSNNKIPHNVLSFNEQNDYIFGQQFDSDVFESIENAYFMFSDTSDGMLCTSTYSLSTDTLFVLSLQIIIWKPYCVYKSCSIFSKACINMWSSSLWLKVCPLDRKRKIYNFLEEIYFQF